MMFQKMNYLVFIALIVTAEKAISRDTTHSEVALKKMSQRIEKVVSQSMEAKIFLEEDLTQAIEALSGAKIIWTDSLSGEPALYVDSFNPGSLTIGFSRFMSIKGSTLNQVAQVTEILFNLKRQLDGSKLSIPKARIQLFAQKFSPKLVSSVDECSLSLSPLPPTFTRGERDEFNLKLVSSLEARGYSYDSTWARNVVFIETKEFKSPPATWDHFSVENKLVLVNLETQKSEELLSVTETSPSGFDSPRKSAFKQLIRKLKYKLPKCNRAFRNH